MAQQKTLAQRIAEDKAVMAKQKEEKAKTMGSRIFAGLLVLAGCWLMYYLYGQISSGKYPKEVPALWAQVRWVGFATGYFFMMVLGDKNPQIIKVVIGYPITAILMFVAGVARFIALIAKDAPKLVPGIGKLLGKGVAVLIFITAAILIKNGKMNLPMTIFFLAYLFEKWFRKLLGKFPKAVFPVAYLKKGFPWFWFFFEGKKPKTKDQEKFAKKLEEEGLI